MPHYRIKKVPTYRMADPGRDTKGKDRLAWNKLCCRSSPFAPSHLRQGNQFKQYQMWEFLFFLILFHLTYPNLWRRSYVVNSSSSLPTQKPHHKLELLQLRTSSTHILSHLSHRSEIEPGSTVPYNTFRHSPVLNKEFSTLLPFRIVYQLVKT